MRKTSGGMPSAFTFWLETKEVKAFFSHTHSFPIRIEANA
jgi:hypothetical protein